MSKKTMLKNIHMVEYNGLTEDDQKEIRFDWDNDRHHGIVIRHPHGPKEVVTALQWAIMVIAGDKKLSGD